MWARVYSALKCYCFFLFVTCFLFFCFFTYCKRLNVGVFFIYFFAFKLIFFIAYLLYCYVPRTALGARSHCIDRRRTGPTTVIIAFEYPAYPEHFFLTGRCHRQQIRLHIVVRVVCLLCFVFRCIRCVVLVIFQFLKIRCCSYCFSLSAYAAILLFRIVTHIHIHILTCGRYIIISIIKLRR